MLDYNLVSANSPWNSYINIINSAIIGDSVTSVGIAMFYDCSGIFIISGNAESEAMKYAADDEFKFGALG